MVHLDILIVENRHVENMKCREVVHPPETSLNTSSEREGGRDREISNKQYREKRLLRNQNVGKLDSVTKSKYRAKSKDRIYTSLKLVMLGQEG